MKQQWTKRILAGVATLALALPIAFGLGQHTVKAADDTQTVILTKFGFDKNPTIGERQTTQTPEEAQADWAKKSDGSAAKALAGVQFKVYDVTATYWADPEKYQDQERLPAYDATNEVKVDNNMTNDDGQITFNLKKVSGNHNAVYVFHEVQQRTGYATSADFMLSLPATANADGNVYVYPKNEQVTTYSHKFKKIDAHTKLALAGAQFKLQQKSDGKFLKLIDQYGNDVVNDQNEKVLTGLVKVVAKNYRMVWGTEDDATIFVSGDDGYFGLDGFDQETKDGAYAAMEVSAPKGYDFDKTKLSQFDADNATSIDEAKDPETPIENTPRGILPHTGGAGILAILAVGSALIAIAFVRIRKRQARA